ncbi:MAG: hypothetical protein QF463_01710 [Vicinamibacterales bacterium]|jgi:hypothetical protein|nr:hypothetical protein [Acidobacteriota bacterium]MDP6373848.1 hypothetical protein [Vicinamibacterales bacterium]MDP6607765.1 hypothetical protein [Vicinamibacterales bacterium]HAK55357.1 hypothetical protein [Acidobacteriota bacterium]
MSLSAILFLFLTHLGIGIAWTLVLVSRDAGVKFFRFNSGLAVTLLVIGLAFRPEATVLGGVASGWGFVALVVATGALLAYWAIIGRVLASLRPALLWVSLLAGAAAIVAQGAAVGSSLTVAPTAVAVASFLTSAALLGSSCTAMSLGHWYLVLPSLDIAPLQGMVKFHIGSIIARVIVITAAVWIAIAGWEPGLGPSFQHYVLSSAGVFFWQRVLFGLLGPGVLSYLTWETAKIRSTQSATGILYVDFFIVIVGEILAKYLHLSTLVPV